MVFSFCFLTRILYRQGINGHFIALIILTDARLILTPCSFSDLLLDWKKEMEQWLSVLYVKMFYWLPGCILQPLIDWVVMIKNSPLLQRFKSRANKTLPPRKSCFTNISRLSKRLMEIHYDQPIELFKGFLGKSMKYSAALWQSDHDNLEKAQIDMMTDLCHKSGIKSGQKILEIGCGFGSLARHIFQNYDNCLYYGVNLSQQQCRFIQQWLTTEEPHKNGNKFILCQEDFNAFTTNEKFDVVVSVGFFEHVNRFDLALEKIASLLSNQGRAFLHYIVYKQTPFSHTTKTFVADKRNSFIEQYIFPGGEIHSYDKIFYFQKNLKITEHWFINGKNYEKTLKAWLKNFQKERENLLSTHLVSKKKIYIWELFFRASIAFFKYKKGCFAGNGQYLLVKNQK